MALHLENPYSTPVENEVVNDEALLADSTPSSQLGSAADDSPIHISNVNFNIQRNGLVHKTSRYAHMKDPKKNSLIVRRGLPFRLTISLSRKFNRTDSVTLVFYCKDLSERSEDQIEDSGVTATEQQARVFKLQSLIGNNSQVVVPVIASSDPTSKSTSKWSAVCDFVGPNFIHVLVQAGVDCIIGRWLMSACVEKQSIVKWFHDSNKTTIYFIFNHFCKSDEVYLERGLDRIGNVEETMALIFTGCEHRVMANFWDLGQYEELVLELALQILTTPDNSVDPAERNSAVKIVTIIANAILRNVKILKRSEKYEVDRWCSAASVIEEYYKKKNKKRPVIYHENKTAAAVLTSIFRCLGIPARPVTGYNLATNTFDKIVHKSKKNKASESSEEAINSKSRHSKALSKSKTEFLIETLMPHRTWVEIYCERRDLGEVHKGWQAISPFGPASTIAIQNCEYFREYGTVQFCKEINKLYTYYSVNPVYNVVRPHNEVLGKIASIINTKKHDGDIGAFLLLGNSYQMTSEVLNNSKSGYSQEISLMQQYCSTTPDAMKIHFTGNKPKDLIFRLASLNNIMLGEPMTIQVAGSSTESGRDWQAQIAIHIFSITPGGKKLKTVKEVLQILTHLTEGGRVSLVVPYSEYSSKIQLNGLFKVIVIAESTKPFRSFHIMDDFFVISIPPPSLLVTKEGITVSLINSLNVPMKNVAVTIFELGMTKPAIKLMIHKLRPTEKWEQMVDTNCAQKGKYSVIAKVVCHRLTASLIKVFNTYIADFSNSTSLFLKLYFILYP